MEVNLVEEGLKFMLLGMGTVFVFLIVMIVAMNLQSAFVHKFLPDDPKAPDVVVSVIPDKKNKIAAIVAAILRRQEK